MSFTINLHTTKEVKDRKFPTFSNHVELVSTNPILGSKQSLWFYFESDHTPDWKSKPLTEDEVKGISLVKTESKSNPGKFYWKEIRKPQ